MNMKLIFSDIDGTLLDSRHHIMPMTKTIIQRLTAGGVPFVPVSARPPLGVAPILRELDITAPAICFSGGLVLDENGGVLAAYTIPVDTAKALTAHLAAGYEAVCCTVYSGDIWAAGDCQNGWVEQEADITGLVPQACALDSFLNGHTAHKIMCMGEPSAIEPLREELCGRFPTLNIYQSKPTYLEIMSKDASKSGAAALLCRHFGVTQADTIAFGDNFNDMDLLRYAGTGVAMGNAPAAVKQSADVVTASNDEEGIYQILKQML